MNNECRLKVVFCQDDCKFCTDENKSEKIQRIEEQIEPMIKNIVNVFGSALEETIQKIKNLWKCIIKTYPNKRVVHLALYHPKERVRKKNINRIMRWINKARCEDDA